MKIEYLKDYKYKELVLDECSTVLSTLKDSNIDPADIIDLQATNEDIIGVLPMKYRTNLEIVALANSGRLSYVDLSTDPDSKVKRFGARFTSANGALDFKVSHSDIPMQLAVYDKDTGDTTTIIDF